MKRTDVIVIGGGQAGLAMSRHLSQRGIDHVVFERRRLAERWRSERWDSLRLLTPNWFSRLPDWRYRGDDPDGFMTMAQVVRYFEDYSRAVSAPVETDTEVRRVEAFDGGYRVVTDGDVWFARGVVIATGENNTPQVPAMAKSISPSIHQIVPSAYRNPGQLPDGGVLVVGASASGVQLADEIHASGRPVTLAAGKHTRLPRSYRGRDIIWWMDRSGILDETTGEVRDLERSRREPSMQLVGGRDGHSIDLMRLHDEGVRIVGRALEGEDARVHFAGDLLETTSAAHRKLARVKDRIDTFATDHGMGREVGGVEPIAPVIFDSPEQTIDLKAEGISTIVWATGFTRRYPWLKVPVIDPCAGILHRDGVTPAAGLYVLGLRFMRRRKSSFIDGVGDDAAAMADHMQDYFNARHAAAA
jgi:putative flavoprotein involved in K+ transport